RGHPDDPRPPDRDRAVEGAVRPDRDGVVRGHEHNRFRLLRTDPLEPLRVRRQEMARLVEGQPVVIAVVEKHAPTRGVDLPNPAAPIDKEHLALLVYGDSG